MKPAYALTWLAYTAFAAVLAYTSTDNNFFRVAGFVAFMLFAAVWYAKGPRSK